MSGHSKWSTIKRQKGLNDKARGQTFSKLSRAITIAVKTGGGPNPDSNYRLRIAIDAARAENMPKDTIDRAINKASGSENVEEVTYEGFGPGGVALIIQAATDNRNRTSQEIKTILERGGGSMGQPGSVSFNFDPQGFLLVQKAEDVEEQMLSLIDLGVDDMKETDEGLEVYVAPQELFESKKKIEEAGYSIKVAELIQKPKMYVDLDEAKAEKLYELLEKLDDLEDVQKIFENSNA